MKRLGGRGAVWASRLAYPGPRLRRLFAGAVAVTLVGLSVHRQIGSYIAVVGLAVVAVAMVLHIGATALTHPDRRVRWVMLVALVVTVVGVSISFAVPGRLGIYIVAVGVVPLALTLLADSRRSVVAIFCVTVASAYFLRHHLGVALVVVVAALGVILILDFAKRIRAGLRPWRIGSWRS